MTALGTTSFDDINRSLAIGAGPRAIVVSSASIGRVAGRIGRADGGTVRIGAPPTAAALVGDLRHAPASTVIIHDLEGWSADAWKHLDRLRSRLERSPPAVFVLSPSSAERLARHAPNLASWIGPMLRLIEAAERPAEPDAELSALLVGFADGEEESAMSAFRQMAEATPERASALLISAVERLLVDALVLPAVFLWGEHRSSEERESRVGARLDAVLVEGWQTTRLWAEGLPAVDLATPAAMKLAADGAEWMCLAGGRSHRGRTRAAAVRAAAVSLIFDALATRWRKETGGLSVVRVRYEHPAMKEILSMGQEVVPEILRRLEHQPDHWHAALAQLTGETPIASGERITASQACRRWVAWGRQRGLAG